MALKVTVGDAFPAFSLSDQDGNTVSRSDLAGTLAVVYFYPRDNTPGCTVEAREFTAQAQEFRARHVRVLGVSTDSVQSHNRFCEKHGLGITLLADAEKTLCRAVGVLTLMGTAQRTTFLLDTAGTILHLWETVKPAGHADDVLATIDHLAKGEH